MARGFVATIHAEEGFKFHVFPNDHRPAHVHAVKSGGDLLVDISGSEPMPIRLRGKMSNKDINSALDIVEEQLHKLREGWARFHGTIN